MRAIAEGAKVFVDGHGETLFTVLGFDSAEGGWYDLESVNLEFREDEYLCVPTHLVRVAVPQSLALVCYGCRRDIDPKTEGYRSLWDDCAYQNVCIDCADEDCEMTREEA